MPSSGDRPPHDSVVGALRGLAEHERQRRDVDLPERYRLGEVIGRGGMAIVHAAHDTQLDRGVAIKIMRDDLSLEGADEARFRREVEATARLRHANVVTVFDAGPDWLVMERVHGESLQERMQREPLAIADAAVLIEHVARGVQAAHDAGIVHRDLKPSNILLDADGTPKVADFGVAHLVGDVTALTQSGMVIGTPRYMAPEQIDTRRCSIGPATDVYALGAILYELLTEQTPHPGDTPLAVFDRIVREEPRPPKSLNDRIATDLQTIVLAALEKDAARRYDDAGALADDLARFRVGEAIVAKPPTPVERLRRTVRKRKGVVAATALGVVALTIALAVLLPKLGESRRTLGLWREVTTLMTQAELDEHRGALERARAGLDRGIAQCRAFLAEDDVADAHYFLGRLLRARGDDAEALAALDRAVERDATLAEARHERGFLLLARYERSLEAVLDRGHARRSAGATPPDVLERRHPAVRVLRRRAIADLSADVRDSNYVREIERRFAAAEVDRLQWRWENAERTHRAILDDDPHYTPSLVALAKLSIDRHDWAGAIGHASAALEQNAGLGEAYLIRARAALESRLRSRTGSIDPDPIRDDLDRAIERLPHNALAYRERGRLRISVADLDGAIADLTNAIERADGDAIAFNARGRAHVEANRPVDAVADFTEAVHISPEFGQAWAQRALVRATQGDTRGAVADARQALEVSPPEAGWNRQMRTLLAMLHAR